MARGITESDVHNAADALVAAGERPTVERIRAHLGTGSPNTVTRWLDTWWGKLGSRLSTHQAALGMPDAPAAVTALAARWWEQALTAAHEQLAGTVADERAALAQARAALAEEQGSWQQQLGDYARMTEEAQRLLHNAEERLSDAQQLCQQQAIQIEDLTAQRDELKTRVLALETSVEEVRQQLTQANTAALVERDQWHRHARAIEDRTSVEIDRARQETKAVRQELQAQLRKLQTELQATQKREDKARQALIQSQQDAAAQRARADTLAKLKSAPPSARGVPKTNASTARKPSAKRARRP
jgi:hypothetical protein